MARSTDYYECRHLGHSWDDIPVTQRPPWGVYIWYRCERCTTERHDIINQFTGDLMSRKYYYPEGYALKKDERPTIQELRQHQLKLSRKRTKNSGRKKVNLG